MFEKNRLGEQKNSQLLSRQLALDIQNKIINLGHSLVNDHPFFIKIGRSELSKNVLALYLYNLKELVTETVPNLKRAIKKAQVSAMDSEFIEALEKKIAEESGHEKWAEEDLKKICGRDGATFKFYVINSMKDFIPYIKSVAENDPLNYFIYAYFIEELMVSAGPIVMSMIMKSAGVSRDELTIIANHIEFDQDHAEEGILVLQKFLAMVTPEKEKSINENLERIKDFIWNLFSDLQFI